ncbi:hypothetical protein SETIT_1G173600v2 [Setaria italica]|uniref:OTU domain-containing protein n=2 Tax=Setaria TaxID=4554 RepID=A0A368PLT8_SETIT|nr:hypothetical protein SETIT_1G173600v2 [Setaria italica]
MASGSGKNQEGNQTKEPVESEESNAATATATAAAAEPPPPASPSERLQERAHGSPEAGGRNSFAATAAEAAAAAQRKGKGIGAPSCRRYAGGKPPLPPLAPSVSRAREPKSATCKPPLPPRAVRASKSKGKKPMSDAEVVKSGMEVRAKWKDMREGRMYMKEVFDELLEESKANAEMDQEDEPEGTAMQQEQMKSATIWPENYYKGSIWRKFLDRIGISDLNSRIANPDVNYETIPMFDIIRHYRLLEMVAGRGVEFHSNALNLRRTYSEFRPVRGDGECFYRSFIFSYLEQVLDRQDTHEEHRLLVAVKEVARQHERLGWASEFSRSHKEFKKLIKKVMRWKRHSRWKHVQTTNSYRKKKLLQYFNSYDKTNDIYAFLRLVAAIWICSHSEEFEPLILEVNEGYTLTDWCFVEVIQSRVLTDHIQMTALVNALRVPLRVEYLFQEFGQDLYTGEGSQDNMPRSTCWPRRHHQVPPDHEVPRVTMLYTNLHYDIIYPDHDAAASQESDKVESPTAKSPSQDQGGSCSGEKSGE